MPRIKANGLEFEYETFGDPGHPPLLLVMGLGAQMITWPEPFCRLLADRGFYVIRYDNRDVGLSSRLDHLGVPDPMQVFARAVPPAYTIDDMADDAAAVLDALGISAAHVVGGSMGGFIVQSLAVRHPEKVLSLTSFMSDLGGEDTVPAAPEVIGLLLTPPPRDREGLIEHGVKMSRVFWAERYFDEERARTSRTAAVDRAISIEGTARQAGACLVRPSRREALGQLRVPALVIHGDADPLVPFENGKRTAAAIPGARLLVLPEAGHDIPPAFYQVMADAIAETANSAREAAPAS
ncbi:MAG TPA: alpha/beta hydrolase [Candidatus Dormibacteraeota bacterium]|jgi:pimeloyl-ACP methyl ester carboxylesterase